jgi:quercetin dioxygenase-like cupin family protein
MAGDLTPKVNRWAGSSSPSEAEINKMLEEQGASGYRWSNAPGDTYSAHSHAYHKMICVIRGSITFGLPAENKEYSLSAGDQLELPAGTMHEALVGPEGVTCYESHF